MVTHRRRRLNYKVRWTAAGFAFGMVFVELAWLIGSAHSPEMGLADIHRIMPVMWVVDLAPSVLGLVGLAIGSLHTKVRDANTRLNDLAEELAETWTHDLRATNAEMAKALADRERLYAAMSHEMRTPLTSILGFSELAVSLNVRPDEASECIHEIQLSSSFLLQMVNELLEVAKLAQGGMTIELDDIDGAATARNVVSLLRPLAESAGLTLKVDETHDAPCRADAVRLRQTLTNLIANAIKYSDTGTITIRTSNDSTDFFIEVVDEGAGLDPGDVERIFLPYEQTNDRDRIDSTGLGLTVSQSLVAAMGGSLTVRSDGLGHGSTFLVTLPVANGMAAETRQAHLTAVAAG